MHGLIANLIVNAGRSILNEVAASASQSPTLNQSQKTTPFSKVMEAHSVKNAHSIQEIFEVNPAITNSELLEISQGLKIDILQSQKGQFGDRAPLTVGEWSIQESPSTDSPQILKITDLEGNSMQIAQDSPIYSKVHLLHQIQDHLKRPSTAFSVL
ncbi:MAG: hypothetical protein AAF212_02765 [Verrucomicrobiota bacterium]